jgi:D-threo-aldose 1-dehydrogenase
VRTHGLQGITVTELGFGGAQLGSLGRVTEAAVGRQAVEAAWAGGVRYFDTAPHYGLGLSERRLGEALADKPRAEYVLSTKVGRMLDPNPAPTGSDLEAGGFAVPDTFVRRFDFSADAVRRSLESSLVRLRTDHVDVVYIHDPDDHVDEAIAEAVPALVRLRDEGVIGAVGVGMVQWQAPLRMIRETDLDVVMLAGRWTLLDRSGEELVDECAARGVGLVAAAPFNSGLLATPHPQPSKNYDYGPASAAVLARAQALADICERGGAELPAAALQFPLRSPATVSVVCGMRTAAEVEAAVRRIDAPLTRQLWDQLKRPFGPDSESEA